MADKTVIDRDSVVRRHPGMVAADLDGDVVMMSLQRGNYYALGPMGSRIWDLLQVPGTVASLCAALEQEYTVDPETCERDVREFLQDLAEQGLVDLGHDSSG